ncbi:MAG: Ig-like domain-containing protein, partial [Cyclobacteriaceae bacterium]
MRQLFLLFLFFSFISCTSEEGGDTPSQQNLQLISVHVGGEELSIDGPNEGLPLDQSIVFRFAQAILTSSVESAITLTADDGSIVALEFSYLDDNKSVSISTDPLSEGVSYTVDVTSELMGANGEVINEIKITFSTLIVPLQVNEITIDGISVDKDERIKDVSRSPEIQMIFSEPVTVADLTNQIEVKLGSLKPTYELSQVSGNTLKLKVTEELLGYREYTLAISDELTNSENKPFEGYSLEFFTKLDSTLKFTEITDDLLLTKIQEQTFKYFWDFAHPSSGLIRERNTSADLVTIGGSGFGLMTILVGIERGFITRTEGVERLETIVDFLQTKAERFHGVWPHWLSGSTGKTIPFSTNDDGGDLVETSFMVQGLLTVRQYLNASDATELPIQTKINQLCDEVEWDWYTQGGQDILYWHWSENFGWEKNHKITGWNEAL